MTFVRPKNSVPAAVYLVADNLDAVLAAGEDLLQLGHRPDCQCTVEFSGAIRLLEMSLAARVLQARARSREVKAVDHRYRVLIDLFVAGTQPLEDAIADLGDSTNADFQSGCCPISYLRSRNVIAGDAASLDKAVLHLNDNFLIAERIELGALLDLCATFLDRLEDHYELYHELGPAADVPGEIINGQDPDIKSAA